MGQGSRVCWPSPVLEIATQEEYSVDERSANPARTLGKTASRLLIRNIHDVKMIEAVLDAYLTFCRETLQVKPRPLVDTDLRSLEFELLSFCAYLVDMMAPKYTALLRARGVVVDPVERFVGGLLEDLDGYFDAMGTKDLRASVIVSTSPEIKFGEGNQLRVEDRYVEYV